MGPQFSPYPGVIDGGDREETVSHTIPRICRG